MCITESDIMAVDIQPPSRMLPPQSSQQPRGGQSGPTGSAANGSVSQSPAAAQAAATVFGTITG